MSLFNAFKRLFQKEEVEETVVLEAPVIQEPVKPVVQESAPEPKQKKESFVCDCSYEFSVTKNFTKVVCPWCGRKQYL